MANTTLRSDLRTEIRDNIQEASGITGALFSDTLLNRTINRELRSLPTKGVYLEQIWEMALDPTVDYTDGITMPTGTVKLENVEINNGTSSIPYWTGLNGTQVYGGALFLPFRPFVAWSIRARLKKFFTLPTDDVAYLDIDDDKAEVLIWGVTVRLYRMMIGYLRGSQSWDSVTKPGDLSIPVIQAWLRDAKTEYNDLIKQYSNAMLPREISLVD